MITACNLPLEVIIFIGSVSHSILHTLVEDEKFGIVEKYAEIIFCIALWVLLF